MNKVYIDLDRVLADFDRGFLEATGVTFDSVENSQDRWNLLKGKEAGFYLNLVPFYGARDFVNDILLLDGPNFVGILSALPSLLDYPPWYNEKVRWNRLRIHSHLPVHIVESSESKQRYAAEGDVLIDDNPLNIKQWNAAGGVGILHRDFETSLQQLKNVYLD